MSNEEHVRPPKTVCREFGVEGLAEPCLSGEGTAFRVDDVVPKPTTSPAEAEWIGETLERVVEDGFRVARPVRTSAGDLVSDGWAAWQWVEGRSTNRSWDEVVAAGERFHAALRGVERPAFIEKRTHQWAVGDRVAFNEEQATIPEPIDDLVNQLRVRLLPLALPSQVVHGDLTENVLLAEGLAPAIIDFSPFYRPTGYASAVVAADAIVWHGAPATVIDLVQPATARYQLLARALIFRLIAAGLARKNDHDALTLQANAHRPLVERVTRALC